MWMAVRDMDIAAELIGIRLLPTKLLAFAVSSFYCGVAGAMLVFLWLRQRRSRQCSTSTRSFLILFMVIIGGLGSLLGSFFGAALIFMPADRAARRCRSARPADPPRRPSSTSSFMVVGALIIFFLIVEPHGLARLWQIGKQKLQGVAVSLLMVHTEANSPP